MRMSDRSHEIRDVCGEIWKYRRDSIFSRREGFVRVGLANDAKSVRVWTRRIIEMVTRERVSD